MSKEKARPFCRKGRRDKSLPYPLHQKKKKKNVYTSSFIVLSAEVKLHSWNQFFKEYFKYFKVTRF